MLEEMMPRWVPTENVNGFEICPGLYRDEGATAFQSAVNFTVHSKGAVTCELLLFHRKEPEPYAVIPFPENCRIGDVFSMMVFGLDIEEFEYAYRLDGPWKPKEGLLFDKKHILLDPYAKAVTGQSVWGKALNTGGYRARVVRNNFFWGSEKPDKIPMEKLQGIFDARQISVFKYNVNNWSHDLYNTSFIHTCFHFLFRFWALAPAQTSVISCVIAACLALLYIIERSLMISCALSVADCIAVIRALCSLAYASTRHP